MALFSFCFIMKSSERSASCVASDLFCGRFVAAKLQPIYNVLCIIVYIPYMSASVLRFRCGNQNIAHERRNTVFKTRATLSLPLMFRWAAESTLLRVNDSNGEFYRSVVQHDAHGCVNFHRVRFVAYRIPPSTRVRIYCKSCSRVHWCVRSQLQTFNLLLTWRQTI